MKAKREREEQERQRAEQEKLEKERAEQERVQREKEERERQQREAERAKSARYLFTRGLFRVELILISPSPPSNLKALPKPTIQVPRSSPSLSLLCLSLYLSLIYPSTYLSPSTIIHSSATIFNSSHLSVSIYSLARFNSINNRCPQCPSWLFFPRLPPNPLPSGTTS